jgi:DNA-binding beta-propeller fold protein YncE
VLVGTGNGFYSEFTQAGALIGQLNTTSGSVEETGCGFDSKGDLITTNFEANNATEFDPTGALIGPFGSGFNCDPESVTFDAAGNVYIGQADCSQEILEFTSTGGPVTTFSPPTENRGTDWIDLAADQCTMFYTSEGVNIHTFNICTNTPGANFNLLPLPGQFAFAFRIRPNGEVLVGDNSEVVRLDAAGNQIQTYTLPGTSSIFALNLDPDGTSFWTADQPSGQVFKVDIASGTVLQNWSAAGVPSFDDVSGLCVKGEIVVSQTATGDFYQLSYFDVATHFLPSTGGYGGFGASGGTGDALLRIVDAGNGTAAPEAYNTPNLCANIFVFNDVQEMMECCSCPLTANSLLTISVINDLTKDPANPSESMSAGVIKIVGSPTCGGAAVTTLAEGLHAWINHTETMASNQAGFKPTPWGFVTKTSVEKFAHSPLDTGELAYLNAGCAEIHSLSILSEHPGICTCGAGD